MSYYQSCNLPGKIELGRAILNYWSLKQEAIRLGRIKRCRAPSTLTDLYNSSPNDETIKSVAKKLTTVAKRETTSNIKYVMMQNPTIGNPEYFRKIKVNLRGGSIILTCSTEQEQRNKVLNLIQYHSNIYLRDFRRFFLLPGYDTLYYSLYLPNNMFNQDSYSVENLIWENTEITSFISKVENSIKLTERIYPYISDINNYYYNRPRLEFLGVSNNMTAQEVLESAINVFYSGKTKVIEGVSLTNEEPKDIVEETRELTAQERLNDYIATVINPRRTSAYAN